MRKIILLTFICLFVFLTACSLTLNKDAGIKDFYTKKLEKAVAETHDTVASVIDTNFYKEINLSQSDISTINNFINSLKKENFIEAPTALPEKPKYKLYLKYNKEKYVINIYNEKYIAIYPWDGDNPMDYIDMNSVPLSLNLFSLCLNLFPQN